MDGVDNLPQLQNFIKRDPECYQEEFQSRYEYYLGKKRVFTECPTTKDTEFYNIVMFIAQVAEHYPKYSDLQTFPEDLVQLLRNHGAILHPDIRLGIWKALTHLRKRELLSPMLLIEVTFDLLRCQDKTLRKACQTHIIEDLKKINAKSKNSQLNRELQDFFSRKLADNYAVAAKTALDVLIELFRKKIWRDKRTVNIIATACYSKVPKIMVAALKFFVGNDEGEHEESECESDNEAPNVKKALLAMRVNKKTKQKRENHVAKIKKAANKNYERKNQKANNDFSALHLLHNPQDVAEKIFRLFKKRHERFEVKLLMLNMVSRLIGLHQLYLPNYFPTLQGYLKPHQRDVTKVMQYACQAAHPLMPPDDIQPVLQSLADNFVTERYAPEVISMGLNAIRELCNRSIHAMDEDLLQDLLGYRNHKDKGVFMASRSLLALFREKNPSLLARKNRCAPNELVTEVGVAQFGENDAKDYIPGAEILAFNTNADDFMKSDEDESSSEEEDNGVEEGDNEEEMEEGKEEVEEEDDNDDDDEEEEKDNEKEEDMVGEEESESEEYDGDCDDDVSEEEERKSITNTKPAVPLKKKEAIRKVMELTPDARKEMSANIVSSRFLTDEDYARIDIVQAAKKVQRFQGKNKRSLKEMQEEDEDKEMVPLSRIEMVYKKRRHDKAARMQMAMEGREDRDKYGSRKGRSNPHASTTNREKSKGKAFNMVKHKVRYNKQKSSFQDKQAKLKISLLRQLKNN